MITEDYILRLIRLGAEFIAKALGLAKEGDFLTSEKTLENGLGDLTGLSLNTLKTIEPEALETMVGGDAASVFVLAEFLGTLAEVEKAGGIFDMYFIYLKKSLELYLLIHVNEDIKTDEPIESVFEKVKETIYEVHLLKELLEFYKTRKNQGKIEEISDMIAELKKR